MDLFSVSGKHAIVTGGSGELAFEMASGLSEAGCDVVLIDYSKDALEKAERIHAKAVIGDLSTSEGCEIAFNDSLSFLDGRLDILINAVGIGSRHRPEEFPIADWKRVIDINLSSHFYMSRLAAIVMLRQHSGRIVNIGSMGSFCSLPENAAYCASKGGVAMLTKSLARDLSPYGINVNAIAPGFMATKLNKMKDDPAEASALMSRLWIPRWGTGRDLVGAVLFLCSEASSYITGVVLPIDGGYLA